MIINSLLRGAVLGTSRHNVARTELILNTNKFNLPEISVHDEANNAQADKCIFPFVHISYPQDNHG